MTLNMENDSNNPESTIFGTSKYLNHTQLRNETESLSLLNTRLVSKNGGKSTAIEEYKSKYNSYIPPNILDQLTYPSQ